MGLAGCMLRVGRLIDKKWRPYCWMNTDYDNSEICQSVKMGMVPPDVWCCKKCPFRGKEEQ